MAPSQSLGVLPESAQIKSILMRPSPYVLQAVVPHLQTETVKS